MSLWLRLMVLIAVMTFAPTLALAGDDEWQGVKAEDLGISEEELQTVKERGMSRKALMHLLEVGVSPNEYFSEPWKKLGVSEDHWLDEKKAGMADDDIDRSYRKQASSNLTPVLSFFMPGYYQYKTGRLYTGLTLSTLAVAGIALTFVHRDKDTDSIYPIYPIISLGAMIFSAADAYLDTRYVDNQDASRFSFDFGILPTGGPAASMSLRF
jgi:hypothetical protein